MGVVTIICMFLPLLDLSFLNLRIVSYSFLEAQWLAQSLTYVKSESATYIYDLAESLGALFPIQFVYSVSVKPPNSVVRICSIR